MRVIPVAQTMFHYEEAQASGYKSWYGEELWDQGERPSDSDELAEFAGRLCYLAWGRKRPETATNKGYLANIISQGHFSVLEHASVSFYVEGVSRSLSHELIRHRHLSFSEVSQRYVNMEEARFITPPSLFRMLQDEYPNITWDESNENFRRDTVAREIVKAYNSIHARLAGWGLKGKKAREAARAVMPNCTETRFVVTGNLRAWRDVLGKRYSAAADAEIRLLAEQILYSLRQIAPNSVQDFPEEPFQ